MTDLSFYIIRNGDGKYSLGGYIPRWSNKPKVWTSRAHAVSSLASAMVTGYDHDNSRKFKIPPEDWELIEINVNFNETNQITCKSILEGRNRSLDLSKKHGKAFSALVEAIEEKDENNLWEWVMCVGGWREPEAANQMIGLLKAQGLKKNKDYRVVRRDSYAAFAFKDRGQSSLIRLAFKGDCASINIRDYVEVDIDAPAEPC